VRVVQPGQVYLAFWERQIEHVSLEFGGVVDGEDVNDVNWSDKG